MCRGADFMLPQSKIRGRNFLESHQFLMLNFCMPEFVLSHFSCVQLFAALWIVAHQALLSMGFSRQEYWTGLPCPPPGNLPDLGIELTSLVSCIGMWVLYHQCHREAQISAYSSFISLHMSKHKQPLSLMQRYPCDKNEVDKRQISNSLIVLESFFMNKQ